MNLEQTLEQGILKASLHNHTEISPDPSTRGNTVRQMIDEAFRQEIGILAFSDYVGSAAFDMLKDKPQDYLVSGDTLHEMNDTVLIIERGKKILYVPRAIEYHSNPDGHVLGFGFKGPIATENRKRYDYQDGIRRIQDAGGIVIAPHPFAVSVLCGAATLGGMGEERLLNVMTDIDGIEVFNAQCVRFLPGIDASVFNEQARTFAAQHNLPGIATTDSRRARDLGDSYFKMPIVLLRTQNGLAFTESMRDAIRRATPDSYSLLNHEGYVPWLHFAIDTAGRAHGPKLAALGAIGTAAAVALRYLL